MVSNVDTWIKLINKNPWLLLQDAIGDCKTWPAFIRAAFWDNRMIIVNFAIVNGLREEFLHEVLTFTLRHHYTNDRRQRVAGRFKYYNDLQTGEERKSRAYSFDLYHRRLLTLHKQHVAEHVPQQLRGMCRDTCRGIFCRPHFSVFIEMSPEEVVAISAAYIVIISSVLKRKRKRRWWMRNFLLQLERRVNILSDLRMSDGSFVNFTCMSSSDFETFLQMIAPSIAKQDTILRSAISPHISLPLH
ncbi:unnamed protein product [Leptosia nina]|uniref:Uncharacterized protein n=1 Tax=Leptosia nina TaxID=320188 RepID=A0AAV1JXP3_9NEOP